MFVIIGRLSTLKFIAVIVSQLKWAWDYLLDRSFYSDEIQSPEIFVGESLGMKYYEKNATDDEDAEECSICLCRIEEGDEVRELKCNHIFHRVCLDRWLGHGRLTCPLCRGHLRLRSLPACLSTTLEVNNNPSETLFFDFCDVSSHGSDKWWLR